MKTLTLMRHAKSDWNDPDQDDFDRPLNDRGRRDAPVMGQFLSNNNLTPDVILCSSAQRTRETMNLVAGALRTTPECCVSYDLYLASPKDMLAAIQQLDDEVTNALMIAHNPGTQMLALSLANADTANTDLLGKIAVKYCGRSHCGRFEFSVSVSPLGRFAQTQWRPPAFPVTQDAQTRPLFPNSVKHDYAVPSNCWGRTHP